MIEDFSADYPTTVLTEDVGHRRRKKYITIKGPTDTNVFGRQKKRPISAKTTTDVLSNVARIITFLSKKKYRRPLVDFGNVTGVL